MLEWLNYPFVSQHACGNMCLHNPEVGRVNLPWNSPCPEAMWSWWINLSSSHPTGEWFHRNAFYELLRRSWRLSTNILVCGPPLPALFIILFCHPCSHPQMGLRFWENPGQDNSSHSPVSCALTLWTLWLGVHCLMTLAWPLGTQSLSGLLASRACTLQDPLPATAQVCWENAVCLQVETRRPSAGGRCRPKSLFGNHTQEPGFYQTTF